jgi:hypothetical protein
VLARMLRNRNPYTLLVGMEISTTIMESSTVIPQKLEIELPYDPVISLLGIYPKELTFYTNVHHSIIHNSQAMETTQIPYD